ncbi:LD-carboxypeptidase [Oculatella sp. LEGE 06141]|uniref:S66 peptidase family protein n=1 Tax=Oculatella sp. LEGE 06141 TaxID=1828648 RepID=UPI001881EC90|nr:LD-carboxypeptidase [Oculatella sp. LEGE 06141]MBE9181255.1 LD-carboxypeptidase [Oculatella sp. LEGE 06141]
MGNGQIASNPATEPDQNATASALPTPLCQRPAPLKPGDLLRVVAPSGTLRELDAFQRGVEVWRSRGYRVECCSGYDDRWGYLAGRDASRRSQLATALNDPECCGVLCARGGYGGARLLEDWTWTLSEPKWLVGFSDITSLLWSLSTLGISGVHAPLLTTLAAEPDWSIQRLFDWVEGRSLRPLQGMGWGGGSTSGILLPANLTVATHLLNTSAQPSLQGVILALEDVSEAPYRIDRMLTQWRMSGAFQQVCGIALGRFSQCQPPANLPSFTVEEVLRDRLADLGIPVVSNLPFGHDGENAALPVGVVAHLDGNNGVLRIGD